MLPLSRHGGFPEWIRRFPFTFQVTHPETDALIATLRIEPCGYECDESQVVYGIYVDLSLEGKSSVTLRPTGDFTSPAQLRALAALLSGPNQRQALLTGDAFRFEFAWQEDGRLRIAGRVGMGNWCPDYLEDRFKTDPLQTDLSFKCSISVESIKNTRHDLANLLQVIEDIEAGRPPTVVES